MSTAGMVVLAVAACAFAYPLVMRVLAAWVHPYRLEMAALGDDLLSSPHIPDDVKDNIEFSLDEAFNWRVFLLIAVFAVIYVPTFIWNKSANALPKIKDEATKAKFERFISLTVRSWAAANPVAALTGAVELALLTLVLAPLGMLGWQLPLLLKAQRKSESFLHHRPC